MLFEIQFLTDGAEVEVTIRDSELGVADRKFYCERVSGHYGDDGTVIRAEVKRHEKAD